MKLFRLVILLLAFGPCPHAWTEVVASVAGADAPVSNVTPQKRRCCSHDSQEPAEAPAKLPCPCHELVFLPVTNDSVMDVADAIPMLVIDLPQEQIAPLIAAVSLDSINPDSCAGPPALLALRI